VSNDYDWGVNSSGPDHTKIFPPPSTDKLHKLGKPDRMSYNNTTINVQQGHLMRETSPLIKDRFWSKWSDNPTYNTHVNDIHGEINEEINNRINQYNQAETNYTNDQIFSSIDGPSYNNGHFKELARIDILNTTRIFSSSYSDMGLEAGNWMMLLERNSVLSNFKFTLYTGHIDSIKDDIALWTNDIDTNNPKDLDLSDNQIIMVSYEDHIVNLTNDTSVNVVNNKYLFNNEISFNYLRKYGLKKQTYNLKGITQDYALRIDCDYLGSYITVTSNTNDVIISNSKNYYYGDNVSVVVSDNFGQASITSINSDVDVKSGEYLFQYNDSDWYPY